MEMGICVRDLAAADLVNLGRFAEDHGYSEVYVPDGARGAQSDVAGRLTGRDAYCSLAAMFAATSTVRGAVGVAAAPLYQPFPLALLASTLQELSEGRFSLGIGVSHPELTSRHGVPFPQSPVAFMADWLGKLRDLSAEGTAFGGNWPVLLAALGPKMVRLGAEAAQGLVLNWLTPEHAARTIQAVREAAPDGTRPRTVLYVRLMPAAAALRDATSYDAFGNYHRNFVAQGLEDPQAIAAGTTLPLEDLAAARERIHDYERAGLDLLCVYPHGIDPQRTRQALAELRPDGLLNPTATS